MKNWIDDFAGKCLTIIGLIALAMLMPFPIAMMFFADTMLLLEAKVTGCKTRTKPWYGDVIWTVKEYVNIAKLFFRNDVTPKDVFEEIRRTEDVQSILNKYGL